MRNARAAVSLHSRRGRRRLAMVAVLALGAGGLTACGKDSPEKLSVSVTPNGKLTGVKQLSGGPVELKFSNGAKLPYDLQIAKVDGGQSVAEVLKVTDTDGGPLPGWLHGAGGVGTTAPGQSATATQVLGPGAYYLIAEADTQGEGPKPVTASLRVAGGKAEGDLPKTDAKIAASEYRFTTSGLKAGKNTIEFDNTGKELHHVIVAPLAPGKTLADARKAFQSEQSQGPPPVDFMKAVGTAVIDGGAKQTTELNLQKGPNVMVCFIQDRAGGPPHVAKGMIQEVNVP